MNNTVKRLFSSKLMKSILVALITLVSSNAIAQKDTSGVTAVKKQLVIAVTFEVPLANREEFKSQIVKVFDIIKKEEKAFNSYSLSEDVEHPGTILLYETWNTDLESFGQGPSAKSYFAPFLKALEQLGVSREAHVYQPL